MIQPYVQAWARSLIERRDMVIIDCESTGFRSEDEILQIVVVNAWGKIAFSSLVKPINPIDEEGDAYKVHGISNLMVKHAPSFADIFPIVRNWAEAHTPIAYNADFDARMLRQDALRHGHTPIAALWDCAMEQYANHVREPGKFGKFRPHKLVKACTDLNLGERKWHDAGADAVATYDLIVALAELPETLF